MVLDVLGVVKGIARQQHHLPKRSVLPTRSLLPRQDSSPREMLEMRWLKPKNKLQCDTRVVKPAKSGRWIYPIFIPLQAAGVKQRRTVCTTPRLLKALMSVKGLDVGENYHAW